MAHRDEAHTSNRPVSRRLALLGLGMAMGAGALPAPAADAQLPHRLSVALAARSSLYHLPLSLAEHLGFLRQAGVLVQWVDTDGGAQAVQAQQNGQADVVAGAFEHVLQLHARGVDQRAFVLMGRSPQLALAAAMTALPDLRPPVNLQGKRIGISSLGSATHQMATHWLLRQGLASQQVQWVEVGALPQAALALREGRIDVLCNPDPQLHILQQQGLVRMLADARSAEATLRWLGDNPPGACLHASATLLQRRPEAVQALTDAMVRTLRWLQTAGPVDLMRHVSMAQTQGDRALFLGAFDRLKDSYSPDGVFQPEQVFSAWRLQLRLPTVRPHRLALERTVAPEWVARSRSRLLQFST